VGCLRAIFLGSPLNVALGSWCGVGSAEPAANGINAGSSSSSSPSSDRPTLFDVNRAGLRSNRLCRGGSESDEESSEVDDGDEGGSGLGDRVRGSMVDTGRDLGFGESERRFKVAWASLGLVWVCGIFRDVTVVFAEEVRENGGAVGVRFEGIPRTGAPTHRPDWGTRNISFVLVRSAGDRGVSSTWYIP
jgi:hypothetical protein